jgi:two-component system, OmpR family, KDP operon response regulator KdpE
VGTRAIGRWSVVSVHVAARCGTAVRSSSSVARGERHGSIVNEPQSLVLVVEDEAQMRMFVRIALEAYGYRVLEASKAADGIRQASKHAPDLVLLDLGLPDADGSHVIRRIREWSNLPILVISARGAEQSKVSALDEGADDYLTKPFGAAELMARVRVALRKGRPRDVPTDVVHVGDDIRVDLARRVVFVRGKEVHLTPIEYKLLETLVRQAGRVVTHHRLLEQVWGPKPDQQVPALRVYMTTLRHKLERQPARPKYLLTEPGIGYRLRLDF